MGRGLILIRHALPLVSKTIPSQEWPLAESSKEDCVRLAYALPNDLARVTYSSTQPKSVETATVIALQRGLSVKLDDGFREVDKPDEWFADSEAHRAAVAGYLQHGGRAGWEECPAVIRRFGESVERAMVANPSGNLIVAFHGMALSIYIASRAQIDLVAFWRALTSPGASAFDPFAANWLE